jgi:arylamine N-acetyltransferase
LKVIEELSILKSAMSIKMPFENILRVLNEFFDTSAVGISAGSDRAVVANYGGIYVQEAFSDPKSAAKSVRSW